MENTERSRRTREAAISAAATILERDGPTRLTLDAIARESGISKGGLTHQFRTKEAVIKALLDHQVKTSRDRFEQNLAALDPATDQKYLIAQLEMLRKALSTSRNMVSAVLAAMAEDPALLKASTDSQRDNIQAMKEEAADADLALLRWTAARGLLVTKMIGMCPFSDEERERLFDRILNTASWPGHSDQKANRTIDT
ncbi:TetR/AcrR family transcriptional regulator [Lichenicola cladoniae]|uniref:TetR/AcrR family transcriptional regulator n=2 Tax=Lichenicola cladoniae TaxID=1484109 RepID=A0A6M8HUS7_9PROT|nr:TetR/AcrR family transcriptional regulator [Acetobacteraceae bacterium]QKE92334.1 TetR/AcrR family transcriptional regulator [Lichenicola cladoniae]